MLKLPVENVQDTKSMEYLDVWNAVLAAVEEKFVLFQGEDIHFSVFETPGYSTDFQMVSEPLPYSLFGVWAYSASEMKLVINATLKEEMHLSLSFTYEHRNGGTNGNGLVDFGESSSLLVYSFDRKEVVQKTAYWKLEKAIRALKFVQEILGMSNETDVFNGILEEVEKYDIRIQTGMDAAVKKELGHKLVELAVLGETRMAEETSISSYTKSDMQEALKDANDIGNEFLYQSTLN